MKKIFIIATTGFAALLAIGCSGGGKEKSARHNRNQSNKAATQPTSKSKKIAEKPLSDEEYRKVAIWMSEKYQEYTAGDIRVDASITDTSGHPLENVRVHALATPSQGFAAIGSRGGLKVESQKFVVDGKFVNTFKGVKSVEVSFEKSGYYPSRSYHLGYREMLRRKLKQGVRKNTEGAIKDGGDEKLVEREISVRLLKAGKTMELASNVTGVRRAWLVLGEAGRTVGWKIDTEEGEVNRVVVESDNDRGLPGNTFYLCTGKGKQEKEEAIDFEKVVPPPGGNPVLVAKELRICLSGSAGGIRIFKPEGNRPVPVQMKRAPKKGYGARRIKIVDRRKIWRLEREGSVMAQKWGYQFFYFKVDGLYGRGIVKGRTIREGEGRRYVVAEVLLQVQPDGSRNLETGIEWR